jgi:hypothetical protein
MPKAAIVERVEAIIAGHRYTHTLSHSEHNDIIQYTLEGKSNWELQVVIYTDCLCKEIFYLKTVIQNGCRSNFLVWWVTSTFQNIPILRHPGPPGSTETNNWIRDNEVACLLCNVDQRFTSLYQDFFFYLTSFALWPILWWWESQKERDY